jgi:hypothetical protein
MGPAEPRPVTARRARGVRLAWAAIALAVLGPAACAREGEGWPPPRGPDIIPAPPPPRPTQAPPSPPPYGQGQFPGGYGPPTQPQTPTRPVGWPAPSSPGGGAPAAGMACRSDQDLVGPLGRCIGGRCGGCSNAADCKPGATCAWTLFGNACMPGVVAGGGGAPAPGPAPGPGPAPTGGGGSLESARAACVAKTNELRARSGVPPLARRMDVEACIDGEAASDGASKRAHGAFGRCGESAQNECPGWNGTPDSTVPSCLTQMWNEGPGEPYEDHGHYINMTSRQYQGVACGFAIAADGHVWLVQDFF